MKAYAALLRGINVGGKNLIKMSELAACFERAGFGQVRTYIQSGNVVFRADEADETELTSKIEGALLREFQLELPVVVRSVDELRDVVRGAPEGFGSDPDSFRYDVIFLMGPLTSNDVLKQITIKEGVDQAYGGDGVLYFSRLTARASQSRLSRIISLPIYQSMTIRNWNTTTRLLEMLEEI